MRNTFGHEIPAFSTFFLDRKLAVYIEKTLDGVLQAVGVDSPNGFTRRILAEAKVRADLGTYESSVHDLLEEWGVQVGPAFGSRAELIVAQILPYVRGSNVSDLGCGDGRVGNLLDGHGLEVRLFDIYEHPDAQGHGLPFFLPKESGRLPFADDSFDTSLLLTVYHHADDPRQLMDEARRVTLPGGRIVVIESVYGVTPKDKTPEAHEMDFLALSPEQQRLAGIFFDHFYNRILHYSEIAADKVPVPFNFQSPEGWKALHEARGMKQTELVHLGIDQKTVPEYHTLHVFEVSKPSSRNEVIISKNSALFL